MYNYANGLENMVKSCVVMLVMGKWSRKISIDISWHDHQCETRIRSWQIQDYRKPRFLTYLQFWKRASLRDAKFLQTPFFDTMKGLIKADLCDANLQRFRSSSHLKLHTFLDNQSFQLFNTQVRLSFGRWAGHTLLGFGNVPGESVKRPIVGRNATPWTSRQW